LVAKAPEAATLHQSAGRKAGSSGARLSGSAATQQRTRVSLSKKEERRAWPIPAAIAGVLVLAVGGYLLWPKQEAPPANTTAPATVQFEPAQADDPNGAPLTASFPATARPMADDEIENALTQADAYLARGTSSGDDAGRFLVFPEDDSAQYLYQRVLAAQPENARAKKGVASLIAFYRRSAHQLCVGEKWIPCGSIARVGLQIDPADDTLVKLNAASEQGQRGETPKIPPLPAE
jgi:hypothetical protein